MFGGGKSSLSLLLLSCGWSLDGSREERVVYPLVSWVLALGPLLLVVSLSDFRDSDLESEALEVLAEQLSSEVEHSLSSDGVILTGCLAALTAVAAAVRRSVDDNRIATICKCYALTISNTLRLIDLTVDCWLGRAVHNTQE